MNKLKKIDFDDGIGGSNTYAYYQYFKSLFWHVHVIWNLIRYNLVHNLSIGSENWLWYRFTEMFNFRCEGGCGNHCANSHFQPSLYFFSLTLHCKFNQLQFGASILICIQKLTSVFTAVTVGILCILTVWTNIFNSFLKLPLHLSFYSSNLVHQFSLDTKIDFGMGIKPWNFPLLQFQWFVHTPGLPERMSR